MTLFHILPLARGLDLSTNGLKRLMAWIPGPWGPRRGLQSWERQLASLFTEGQLI